MRDLECQLCHRDGHWPDDRYRCPDCRTKGRCNKCERISDVGDAMVTFHGAYVTPDLCQYCKAEKAQKREREIAEWWIKEWDRRRKRLRQSIPAPALAVESFADFAREGDDAAAGQVADWSFRADRNLWLWGEPGSGKTTLAALAADALCDQEDVGALLSVQWMDAAARKLPYAEDVEVLVLDDLNVERSRRYASVRKVDRLTEIVRDAYDHGRRLVVTSNYPPHEIADRLEWLHDEATAVSFIRRVSDWNGDLVVEVRGGRPTHPPLLR